MFGAEHRVGRGAAGGHNESTKSRGAQRRLLQGEGKGHVARAKDRLGTFVMPAFTRTSSRSNALHESNELCWATPFTVRHAREGGHLFTRTARCPHSTPVPGRATKAASYVGQRHSPFVTPAKAGSSEWLSKISSCTEHCRLPPSPPSRGQAAGVTSTGSRHQAPRQNTITMSVSLAMLTSSKQHTRVVDRNFCMQGERRLAGPFCMLGCSLQELRHAREGGHLLGGFDTHANTSGFERLSKEQTATPDVRAYNQSK
ncbi:hypothetical protein HNQ05_000249 [Oceanithermus desulfurans]|uniref:Uncharacterized protein n=1 Tax=Oceanithermus desulfurans TaxID=227924 RepID=A0ABR6NYU9_9DEIN|nr:hypothetical protein [Oceanithermus desulfurans]